MADEKPEALAIVTAKQETINAVAKRNITEGQWRTLCNSLFPGANPQSVLLVIDYCQARNLDPMKKPVHIVPMEVKDARTGQYRKQDVVMPGIYEYRTTAHRTREYLGHSEAEYGEAKEFAGVMAPVWCAMTVYRWNANAGEKVPFPVRVHFSEVVATNREGKANARWSRAPIQMLTKCTEAAAIREAFPEEIGGEHTAEEMFDQRAIDIVPPQVSEATVSLLDKLPEAFRDNVERALSALKLTVGQRQAKINEFIGGEGIDPEDGAGNLLKWAESELKAPTKAKADNGKKRANAGGPRVVDAVPAVSLIEPSGPAEASGADTPLDFDGEHSVRTENR